MSSSLHVNWAFGFSKDVTNSVHNLTTEARNAIFYLSSHSGVIYDFEHRTQVVLQGHCNQISCCTVSPDKRWIVTADIGEDPIFVVWDSFSGAPVKTIFNPHRNGVKALDISNDAMYIITLSEREEVSDGTAYVHSIDRWKDSANVENACGLHILVLLLLLHHSHWHKTNDIHFSLFLHITTNHVPFHIIRAFLKKSLYGHGPLIVRWL